MRIHIRKELTLARRGAGAHIRTFSPWGISLRASSPFLNYGAARRRYGETSQYRPKKEKRMQVMLWFIAIIFIIGLLVVTGVLGLIF